MPGRLITLTTDFGVTDHYAGVLKGVIAAIAPLARVVDITHDIAPYEIAEGAFTIDQVSRYFPKRTIHVIVVDPGVGSERRAILAEAHGQFFVAPDNGVLAMMLAREPKPRVRHITNDKYFRHPVSNTFHGRDIFSPVAAHLAAGVAPARFGPRIDDYLRPRSFAPVRTGKRVWTGTVLKVDRFGNCITNFPTADFPELALRHFEMLAGIQAVTKFARFFSESTPGELCVMPGSSGFLEIVANQTPAAKALGISSGAPVELTVY